MCVRPKKDGKWDVLVPKIGDVYWDEIALGNMSQYRVCLVRTRKGLFVGIERHSCYEFGAGAYAHWGYVADNLALEFEGDARAMADLINDQLQNESERQGTYEETYCQKGLRDEPRSEASGGG